MPADLVLTNAEIYTAEGLSPWAQAMACFNGVIISIGSLHDVEPLIGSSTELLDAASQLVLPGFIDAHIHLIWGYELGAWIDLTDHPSLSEVKQRIAAHAELHPEEAIVFGHGFDYTALKAQGLPGKEELDEVVSDRPVLLSSWDGHTGWGNSRFVERALDVMCGTGQEIGEMQHDPNTGKPTGIFHRIFDLTSMLPEIQARRSLEGLRQTLYRASSYGITTAFDVQVELKDLHAYEELRRMGGLAVRMGIAIYHPRGTSSELYSVFEESRSSYRDDEWLRVDAVKLYIDGVQETGTAALLDP